MRMQSRKAQGRSRDQPDPADRRRAAAGHLLHAVVHLHAGRPAQDRAAAGEPRAHRQAEGRSASWSSVTQSGSYRVNDRELINSSPDTLRAAILEVAGADREQAGHGARRRTRHAPVGGHRHGRARQARLRAHQHRDGRRLPAARNEHARRRGADRRRDSVYRRLLGYARPHLGMFLIGVRRHGAVRRHRPALRLLRAEVRRPAASSRRTRQRACGWCRSARRCCSCCAASATTCRRLFSRATSSRQVIKAHSRATCSASTCTCPRGTTTAQSARHDAVAAHVQHRAGGRGHHQVHQLR